jgi:hypothetical protein
LSGKICQRADLDGQRLRNLAIQLAAQFHPDTYSKQEAQEVIRLLHDLIEWEYKEIQPERDLKVV